MAIDMEWQQAEICVHIKTARYVLSNLNTIQLFFFRFNPVKGYFVFKFVKNLGYIDGAFF